ncbi:MAG: acyl-CoA dehydrogenase [Acidobacteria bacterium]|nr:MAG: acyl-CoA dehydrogenase [Acidobacteriota bacterium]GIK77904.1 MAG: acyl-CoA dehydrogenase [Actinomycetes bacterium]
MARATDADAAPDGDGEELEMLRDSLRRFVADELAPRAAEWEDAGTLPRAVFERLGELGFLGMGLAPEHGGGGRDFRYTAVLVEELVRCGAVGVAVSVLVHAEFATKVIDRAGSPGLRAEILPDAIAGRRIGALGVTEPGAGSDVGAIRTRAVRDGDEYVIDGAKTFITNAPICDFVTLAVRTGGSGPRGVSLLVVPADAPGLTRGRRLRKIGTHASDTGELSFDGCRVPARCLLGEEGAGFRLIMEGFRGERLVLALICCAQMRLMWEEARRYGLEREAFGRPLLGFQSWQHRLADSLTTIEAAGALTGRALELYVAGRACDREVSMAKLFAAESATAVAHDCAQIFGGYGYMEESLIARLVRDSMAFSIGAGTSEVMREIVAREAGLVPAGERL